MLFYFLGEHYLKEDIYPVTGTTGILVLDFFIHYK